MYVCHNGCDIDSMIVCGGSIPYFNHECELEGNIYFFADLDGKYTEDQFTQTPFGLTSEDWISMHSHADGGCCSEPQCPVCLDYLEVS